MHSQKESDNNITIYADVHFPEIHVNKCLHVLWNSSFNEANFNGLSKVHSGIIECYMYM